MRRRLAALIRKEFIHILRDMRSLTIIFLMPVIMILVYSYAITFDIKDIQLALLDESRSPESRRLVEHLTGSHYFVIADEVISRNEIEGTFLNRRAIAVLIIPNTYAADLRTGMIAPVQIVVDGSNANTAVIAVNYFTQAQSSIPPAAAHRTPGVVQPRSQKHPLYRPRPAGGHHDDGVRAADLSDHCARARDRHHGADFRLTHPSL